jgi:hypothetical protein
VRLGLKGRLGGLASRLLGLGLRLPKPRLRLPRPGLGKPRVGRRPLVLAASLAAYALGAFAGTGAVRGALHGLVYPAWLAMLTYVGILHGAEGTLAVLALAPLLALFGYMVVVTGVLLTGSWPAALASAPQLIAAALSSAAVYASSYAMARAAVGGKVWWETEGPAEGRAGEGAAPRGGGPLAAQLSRAVGGWLRRLRPPRRARRRRRRGGRPL